MHTMIGASLLLPTVIRENKCLMLPHHYQRKESNFRLCLFAIIFQVFPIYIFFVCCFYQ